MRYRSWLRNIFPLTLAMCAHASGFQQPRTYNMGGHPIAVAVADLNRDGYPDIAVAVHDYFTSYVRVLLANPDGTFNGVSHYTIAEPVDIVSGDFDGDGNPDLAVAENYLASIEILLGHGDGTFTQFPRFSAGTALYNIESADFNGDGKQDLAVCLFKYNLPGQGAVGVLMSNGDGTFQGYIPYFAGQNPNDLVAADFNRDGIVDLAVADQDIRGTHKNLAVLFGNGDGSLTTPLLSRVSATRGGRIAAADINGDGNMDLATTADADVFALLGHGDGKFTMSTGFHFNFNASLTVTLGDVDGDGIIDLLVPVDLDSGIVIFHGNGDGSFRNRLQNNFGEFFAAVADFNQDGVPDLLAATVEAIRVALGSP